MEHEIEHELYEHEHEIEHEHQRSQRSWLPLLVCGMAFGAL
jgi:hypothetical protein